MHIFKTLLLGASLATSIVALPFLNHPSETEIAERPSEKLLPRNDLFPAHGTYSKKEAIEFVQNIPSAKLTGFSKQGGSIYSPGGRAAKDGHRLDMQGMTSQGYHNIQVQMNGQGHGRSTVGGLLVKGTWSAQRTRKELGYSIMHPGRNKDGKEYLRKQKDGKAPTHADGRRKTNAEARKGGQRAYKFNPNARKHRKAARKAAWQ